MRVLEQEGSQRRTGLRLDRAKGESGRSHADEKNMHPAPIRRDPHVGVLDQPLGGPASGAAGLAWTELGTFQNTGWAVLALAR